MREAKVSAEAKKAEAIERMKMLGIFPQTIEQFRRSGLVSISEPPFGAFYWANDEEKKLIQQFEAEYNALVYVVVRSFTEFGKLDAYLYVSDYEEEWKVDRNDIEAHQPIAYVYNHDIPEFSEIGAIGVRRTAADGLLRTW